MFSIHDRVLYGSHGACIIVDIETMRFGKTEGKYYVLQPVTQADSKYYVPVSNEAAVAKIRPLMSAQELLEMLHSGAVREKNWIADEHTRKLRYKELLSGGDRVALVNMIYCLYDHKNAQLAAGKKFHQCDENFLHDALKLLNSEFALVFDLKQGQVDDFIREHLSQQG